MDDRYPSQPVMMATGNIQLCLLHVALAVIPVFTESLPDNEIRALFVEIRQDQAVKHVTGAVERNEILIWNEELLIAGNNLSTISLLVLENG